VDFGVVAKVVFETLQETGDVGGSGGLRGERLVDERDGERTVGGGEGGEPFLFHGVAFVAGEAVEAFQIHDVGSVACGEGAEDGAEQRMNRAVTFLGAGVAGGELGEGGGVEEGFVAAADAGVAGDEAGFFYEPGIAGGGTFKEEGYFVEEVECEVVCGGLFRDALDDAERAALGGEDAEDLKRVCRRLAEQHERIGGEGRAAHEGTLTEAWSGVPALPAEGEGRDGAGGVEELHCTGFGGAHFALFGGLEVVVAGEVEPAVDNVEGELFAEIAVVGF
jgi:hypothetical protein